MLKAFTVDEENTVLLIIDIQDRLVVAMEHKDRVIKNSQILIESAELLNIPIILTEQYPKGLGRTVNELTEDTDFYGEIYKTSFSAYNDELSKELKKLGKKNVIAVGMESHVCVLQTVRDLLKDVYHVHLASMRLRQERMRII